MIHSAVKGSADDSAEGRLIETRSKTTAAMVGLAIMSVANLRSARLPLMPAARAAADAAVSHSSSRRLVMASLTSVNTIACAVSQA